MKWSHIERMRRTLSREQGTIVKDWGGKVAIALAYPNSYRVGMSSLGFQTVYRLLNELDGIVCERSFLPDKDVANTGDIISIESGRPISTFDVIAVSLSFENDYSNLLTILQKAGLVLKIA